MTIEFELPHAQARAYLHTGRRALTGGAAKQLDAHLAGCAACRAYAAYLAQAEPALTAALRAQWDPAQPPQSERAFAAAVQARFTRPHRALPGWLSGAGVTLAVGAALLVLVVVWISAGWGVSPGGPQPTEVVVESLPLPEVTAVPLGPTGPIIFSGLVGPDTNLRFGIYAWPAAGDAPPINLTPYAQQTYGGVWSPDGQWIALIGREFSGLEVFVMRADGSGLRKISPPSAADWQYMEPLSWSPDGQTVAVARTPTSSNIPVSIGQSEIILLAADGSGSRPLVAGYSPKWSPDGERLAFLRRPTLEGGTFLFTTQSDGSDEHQIGEFQFAHSEFDWSPDGSQLAFTAVDLSQSERGPIGLYLTNSDGSQVEELLTFDTEAYASTRLHWSPTGDYLLFDANLRDASLQQQPGLYLFSFATRKVTLALPDVLGDFSWSPDGRYFVATSTGSHSLYQFALQPDGSPVLAATVLVPDISVSDPQWRPSGPALVLPLPTPAPDPSLPADLLNRWVAFVTRTDGLHNEVYVMRTDGRDGQRLTGLPETLGYDHNLVWSPDGTRLAFVSDRSGQPEVYVAQVEVWMADQLTASDPALAATDYSLAWSPDGEWLAVTVVPNERGPNWVGGDVYLLASHGLQQPFPSVAVPVASRVTDPAQWSPNGAWLAYGGLDDNDLPALYAVNVAGIMPGAVPDPAADLPVKLLAPTTTATADAHDIYLGYAWTPDGGRLTYLRQGPYASLAGVYTSIETGPLLSSLPVLQTVLSLYPSPNGIMGLSWSPDGAYLLFLSDAVTGGDGGVGVASTGCWTPRLLPAGGGALVHLDGVCYLTRTALPQWSPDSRYLLLTAEGGLAVVEVPEPAPLENGGAVQPLFLPLPEGDYDFAHSPAWQPGP